MNLLSKFITISHMEAFLDFCLNKNWYVDLYIQNFVFVGWENKPLVETAYKYSL
jgi:hypothetical protein